VVDHRRESRRHLKGWILDGQLALVTARWKNGRFCGQKNGCSAAARANLTTPLVGGLSEGAGMVDCDDWRGDRPCIGASAEGNKGRGDEFGVLSLAGEQSEK
jgi:hypothetical protein